jgi:predicted dehydrogenase
MKIGVIGLGYWGPNLVRNLSSLKEPVGVVCCDLNNARLNLMEKKFPLAETTDDYQSVLNNPDVEGVCICTPVSLHYKLAKEALLAGKHVLVEKPMTDSSKDAMALIELAAQKNLILMVDHTFLYTGAVRKIKELVSQDEIGSIMYFDSVRLNLGLFQHDVNVIWDLAPHDLSIMNYIVNEKPVSVSACGSRHFNGKEDMAYITIKFESNLLAHFHVNWLSPVKVRTILIGGDKKMIVYNDMESSEKIKIYNKGVDVQTEEMRHQLLVHYRNGDMYSPNLEQTEALSLLCEDFIDCIMHNKKPLSDGASGYEIVRIIEASQQSLALSRPIYLQ